MIVSNKSNVICLFEQSGTFKNQFKQLGYDAIDVDIENKFGQTDQIVDIFETIDSGEINKLIPVYTRLVMCFFPCTRFSSQFEFVINCSNYGMQDWSDFRKLVYSRNRERERSENYERLCEIILHCLEYKIPLVIENPKHKSYLLKTLPIKPTIIHTNRADFGDNFKKPTMYYMFNMKKSIMFSQPSNDIQVEYSKRVEQTKYGIERSIISPEYARNFILTYIDGNI